MADRSRGSNVSPVDAYLELDGYKGIFTRYDKETTSNVQVPIADAALLTDERFSVVGYSDQHENGIFSNEVGNIKEDELVVKIFQKKGKPIELCRGVWESIKGTVKAAGGKFCKCAYLSMEGKIYHVAMAGCAFGGANHYLKKDEGSKGGWIKFNTKQFMTHVFSQTGSVEGQKNDSQKPFFAPVFSFTREMDAAEAQTVEAHYDLVQQFFGNGGHQKATDDESPPADESQTDTSNWRDYEIRPGEDLHQFTLEGLQGIQADLEERKDFGEAYDMVTAGIFEYQKEAKSKAPAQQTQQPPAQEPGFDSPNVGLEVAEWEQFKMPKSGNGMGTLTDDQLKQALDYVNSSKNNLDMQPYLVQGIADRKKDAEAAAAAEANESEQEEPSTEGMPDCF